MLHNVKRWMCVSYPIFISELEEKPTLDLVTIAFLTVFFMCAKRKQWPLVTAYSLPQFFFLLNFPNVIQLLPDQYLRSLHLRGLQQGGAEAHPSAPHAGESPQYLHFCEWGLFFFFFALLLNNNCHCVWECVKHESPPAMWQLRSHEFHKLCDQILLILGPVMNKWKKWIKLLTSCFPKTATAQHPLSSSSSTGFSRFSLLPLSPGTEFRNREGLPVRRGQQDLHCHRQLAGGHAIVRVVLRHDWRGHRRLLHLRVSFVLVLSFPARRCSESFHVKQTRFVRSLAFEVDFNRLGCLFFPPIVWGRMVAAAPTTRSRWPSSS